MLRTSFRANCGGNSGGLSTSRGRGAKGDANCLSKDTHGPWISPSRWGNYGTMGVVAQRPRIMSHCRWAAPPSDFRPDPNAQRKPNSSTHACLAPPCAAQSGTQKNTEKQKTTSDPDRPPVSYQRSIHGTSLPGAVQRWRRRISEAQGRPGDAASDGSLEQTRDLTHSNRIAGSGGGTNRHKAAKSSIHQRPVL